MVNSQVHNWNLLERVRFTTSFVIHEQIVSQNDITGLEVFWMKLVLFVREVVENVTGWLGTCLAAAQCTERSDRSEFFLF